MTDRDDFLVEVGTEELPPKALLLLSRSFRSEIEKGLDAHGLAYGEVAAYATPRRLAVKVSRLAVVQDDQRIQRRGPATAAAFDVDGKPTKAALGFARSVGAEVENLGREKTDKGEWLCFTAEIAGQPTVALLPDVVSQALAALPIPKPMRWGNGTTEFVRPVHWVVLLFGTETVTTTILGIKTGAATRGHRFHWREPILLKSPRDYPRLLQKPGHVIADFEVRHEMITRMVEQTAIANDGRAVIDPDLLNEVTALVEWPVPVCGSFDEKFLDLPRDVLVASMQDHQKYFPVESGNGTLINKFITVSNIESTDPDAVRRGNERVIRPRLSDAAFFWDRDRALRLEQRTVRLDGIVFEKRLGSLSDKTKRVAQLARTLALDFDADPDLAVRAANLSRCDLVTAMVGEFPELQGIMGGYYAAHDEEPRAVSDALGEFYMPRFAGDSIPATTVGRCIAYADKLDSLVGIFAVGSAPTGDKDPYALRRAALGCIRIALESGATVDFKVSLEMACDGYANVIATDGVGAEVFVFIIERLRGYFADQGVAGSVIEAVLAITPYQPSDIHRRIKAVTAFQRLPESKSLAAANKRIANILRKSGIESPPSVNAALLQAVSERILADHLDTIAESADELVRSGEFEAYLKGLAKLHDPINDFFDDVMVMCDDPQLRNNRLALLHRIQGLFTRVADISRL